jgi:predicted anti-sigma-YlaC factor YlaD
LTQGGTADVSDGVVDLVIKFNMVVEVLAVAVQLAQVAASSSILVAVLSNQQMHLWHCQNLGMAWVFTLFYL